MRPLVVDTSVWVDWLRGNDMPFRERAKSRLLFMPAVVALELRAGAVTPKAKRVVDGLVERFSLNNRLVLPKLRDYLEAGAVLAKLRWSATAKANDALIAVVARSIGAEIWTTNQSDFAPLGKVLRVPLTDGRGI